MSPAPDFPTGIFPSPFRAAWWLRNPHLQTLFSSFFRVVPQVARERESVTLPDGDFLDLDWHLPEGWTPTQPLVLVVHGLSGSSDSHYVLGLQAALAARGWGSVALNCRGASRPNNLPRAYHAGGSDDLRHALAHLRERYPQAPRAIVGYSLGGNMTLKLLGELAGEQAGLGGTEHPDGFRQGNVAPLSDKEGRASHSDLVFAGVAVSVPLLLPLCADRMDRGVSRIYRRHFIASLVAHWEEKMRHLERAGNAEGVRRIKERLRRGPFRSFWQFDDEVMAPMHGFADVHDYYRRSSSRQFLRHIAIPTLVIHASDDPLMSPGVLPEVAELSPAVHFELCREGGHVGFIEGGSPRLPRYYLERRIPDFLEARLRMHKPDLS